MRRRRGGHTITPTRGSPKFWKQPYISRKYQLLTSLTSAPKPFKGALNPVKRPSVSGNSYMRVLFASFLRRSFFGRFMKYPIILGLCYMPLILANPLMSHGQNSLNGVGLSEDL